MYRSMVVSGILLLLAGLASAQVNGQASVVSEYAGAGVYSMPVVPLVNTPSLTLGVPSLPAESGEGTANDGEVSGAGFSHASESFNFGAARSQSSSGAAELASRFHPAKAAKVYTNQDVAQVNGTNGLVKFGNKTERL
jgi:hypothetical protein